MTLDDFMKIVNEAVRLGDLEKGEPRESDIQELRGALPKLASRAVAKNAVATAMRNELLKEPSKVTHIMRARVLSQILRAVFHPKDWDAMKLMEGKTFDEVFDEMTRSVEEGWRNG